MEINPSFSSRRWYTTCPHIHLALYVEDSREVFWEIEPHALQGPSKTSNRAVYKPAASLEIISLNHFQGKPRAQCHLDKFPVPEFNYCPGQPERQLLVTFCIPRVQGILIILKGKISFFFSKYKYPWWNFWNQLYFGSQCQNAPLDPLLSFSFGFLFPEACSLDCFD